MRVARELTLREVLERRECIVALAEAEVTAAMLCADVLLVGAPATLTLNGEQVWGGVMWRIGARATLALHFDGTRAVNADDMLRLGIADGRAEGEWLRGRSAVAQDSAAMLLRSRGGDALERAEFARLFAAGIPQEGLRAFLEKRKANFR